MNKLHFCFSKGLLGFPPPSFILVIYSSFVLEKLSSMFHNYTAVEGGGPQLYPLTTEKSSLPHSGQMHGKEYEYSLKKTRCHLLPIHLKRTVNEHKCILCFGLSLMCSELSQGICPCICQIHSIYTNQQQ